MSRKQYYKQLKDVKNLKKKQNRKKLFRKNKKDSRKAWTMRLKVKKYFRKTKKILRKSKKQK